jgi:hypothetical protein
MLFFHSPSWGLAFPEEAFPEEAFPEEAFPEEAFPEEAFPGRRRVLPVRSSCSMPCLRARVLSRRCSSAASSPSMSERTVAMAVCSGRGGRVSVMLASAEDPM